MGSDVEMIVFPGKVLITEATSLEIIIIIDDVLPHVISISIIRTIVYLHITITISLWCDLVEHLPRQQLLIRVRVINGGFFSSSGYFSITCFLFLAVHAHLLLKVGASSCSSATFTLAHVAPDAVSAL